MATLAKTLDVSAQTIASWLDGDATPPVDIYIKALDLVASGQHRRAKTYG
jgi:DNA-binding XRE family transcriptional regulator